MGIILRLGMPHLVIFFGFICKQFLVGSGLDDSALVEHQAYGEKRRQLFLTVRDRRSKMPRCTAAPPRMPARELPVHILRMAEETTPEPHQSRFLLFCQKSRVFDYSIPGKVNCFLNKGDYGERGCRIKSLDTGYRCV